MEIVGINTYSMIDFNDLACGIVFSPGCNFRCVSCHAKHLVDGENNYSEQKVQEVLDFLEQRKKSGWIGGVVLCGGEPTLQEDLPEFAGKLKERGLAVKLDTNGYNTDVIRELVDKRLVDYVAMDVKGPRELYPQLTRKENLDTENLEKTMQVLSDSDVGYEFRTTVVPIFKHPPRSSRLYLPEFLNEWEAEQMAKWVVGVTGTNQHRYLVQPFVARTKQEMLDERFSKENLPAGSDRTPEKALEKVCETIKRHIPKCKIRGK